MTFFGGGVESDQTLLPHSQRDGSSRFNYANNKLYLSSAFSEMHFSCNAILLLLHFALLGGNQLKSQWLLWGMVTHAFIYF